MLGAKDLDTFLPLTEGEGNWTIPALMQIDWRYDSHSTVLGLILSGVVRAGEIAFD